MNTKNRSTRGPLICLALLGPLGFLLFLVVWQLPVFALAWSVIAFLATLAVATGSAGKPLPGRTVDRGREASAPVSDHSKPLPAREYGPLEPRGTTAPGRPAAPATAQRVVWPGASPRRVAIAGVGDIGSRVAITLVQSSLGRISLADMDVVEYDNIGQSAFRSIDVGHSKVAAVERLCREINPSVEVRTCEADLQSLSELDLGIWLSDASLLVLGIDDPVALLRLHDHCYGRIPMVAAGIHDRGESGHVVYTIPGKTSCFRCALGIRKAGDIVQIRGNDVSPDDVQRIAGEAASIALKLLDPRRAMSLDPRRNVLFMNNREIGGFRSTEAHWLDVERQPNCRVCRGGSAM